MTMSKGALLVVLAALILSVVPAWAQTDGAATSVLRQVVEGDRSHIPIYESAGGVHCLEPGSYILADGRVGNVSVKRTRPCEQKSGGSTPSLTGASSTT